MIFFFLLLVLVLIAQIAEFFIPALPWLYNAQTKIMITYDDAQSLGIKADFVRARGLGGVMFWELSGDDAAGTLLGAVNEHLK